MMDTPSQSAVANRPPAGQSDGSGKFGRDACSRWAFPAVVAKLGRCNHRTPWDSDQVAAENWVASLRSFPTDAG